MKNLTLNENSSYYSTMGFSNRHRYFLSSMIHCLHLTQILFQYFVLIESRDHAERCWQEVEKHFPGKY